MKDMQLKVAYPFSTSKYPDVWNKIHKLKPQLSSSINILEKLQITNNITNTTNHWVIQYFIKTNFLFLEWFTQVSQYLSCLLVE